MEELSTGVKVGPYQLLFRLGKGGMGEVWCASSGSSMGGFTKLVALKLLLGAEEGSNSSVMFFDEAKVAAALQHASIVPTLDLGQDQDCYYLAMEMIRGPSLTALLQRVALQKKMLPPAIIAYIGERIANALDYANARAELNGQKLKLVHRDISPHNVLLDLVGNVVLSDFGVARTAVQDHKSRYGTVRGKPSYMAPEQVTGGDIDGRTDVFALGTVLYESACVKRLFGRGNPVKSMEAVVKDEPKPLTERVPGFPKDLADVIHKALQKKPENRWQSAAEMAQALGDCARKLKGSSTVTRDLSELVNELFPQGSFDVDSKAQEALAVIGEATSAGEPMPPRDPTMVRPMAIDGMAPQEIIGTQVAWPMADAADPLAPEALEEAQHQIQLQTQFMYTPSASVSGMQQMAFTNTATSYTGMGPTAPSRGSSTAILSAAVIASTLAIGGVVWAVMKQQSDASSYDQTTPPTRTVAADTPKGFGVVQGHVEQPEPTQPPEPEPVKRPAEERRSPTRPIKTRPPSKERAPDPEPPPPPKKDKPKPAGRPSFNGPDVKSNALSCVNYLKSQGKNVTTLMMGISQSGSNESALRKQLEKCKSQLDE